MSALCKPAVGAIGPNPLPAARMTPSERRAELCGLLALGLIRLRQASRDEVTGATGESSLHLPPDRSGHATPTDRRPA